MSFLFFKNIYNYKHENLHAAIIVKIFFKSNQQALTSTIYFY